MLYEMLTGTNPFRGANGPAIAYAIVNEDPQPAAQLRPAIGRDLERILKRALAKSPGQRYQSMIDLLDDLSSLDKQRPAETSGV